jgi:DNA polymerase III subunit gamma/tau
VLCESPVNGEYCGECHICKDWTGRNTSNFIEVDAATNSGKADMKKLIERVKYSGINGRTIILFDEAHRLTKEALDAILKLMEEDDENGHKQMVCVFATTEPEKMRSTILSRCAPIFQVRRPESSVVVGRLKYICEREGIKAEDSGLDLIAQHSDRHLRDSIKRLENAATYLPEVTYTNVYDMFGLNRYRVIIDALNQEDPEEIIQQVVTSMRTENLSPTETLDIIQRICLAATTVQYTEQTPPWANKDQLVQVLGTHGVSTLARMASNTANAPRLLSPGIVVGCILQAFSSTSSRGTLPAYKSKKDTDQREGTTIIDGIYKAPTKKVVETEVSPVAHTSNPWVDGLVAGFRGY